MFERMKKDAPKPSLYGNDYKKVTLKMMLDHNINEYTQDFEELSTAAAKQHGLLKAMRNMKAASVVESLSWKTSIISTWCFSHRVMNGIYH